MGTVIYLVLGSLSTALFIFMLLHGKKYEQITESVSEDDFRLKDLYTVGFAWSETIPGLGYKGSFAKRIKTDVALLHGEKYAEFYVRMYLAQAYTYAHLAICFFWILAGMSGGSNSLLLLVAGVVLGMIAVVMSLKDPQKKVIERTDDYLIEFPNVVTKLALMIDTGMILRDAWVYVTDSTKGRLKEAMTQSCDLMKNGYSEKDAIYYFGQNSGTKEIKKFSSIVIQGIDKGNADLALLLKQQSTELWEVKRQRMLQKGEEAATKLVIPTTLMFVGIIIVIISGAMNGMSL